MSMHSHYCCQKCGFKLQGELDKCISCGHKKITLPVDPINLKKTYKEVPKGISIQVSLHQEGSRISDKEDFKSVNDLIDWLNQQLEENQE